MTESPDGFSEAGQLAGGTVRPTGRSIFDQTAGKKPMTTQEYLIRPYHCKLLIQSKREQLNMLRDLLTNLSVPTDRGASSGMKEAHGMERMIASITDLEDEIRADEVRLAQYEFEIISLINRLSDYRERSVMILRYMRYMDWKGIAGAMDLSMRYVQTIHTRALKNTTEIMKREKIVLNVEARKSRAPYVRFTGGGVVDANSEKGD